MIIIMHMFYINITKTLEMSKRVKWIINFERSVYRFFSMDVKISTF